MAISVLKRGQYLQLLRTKTGLMGLMPQLLRDCSHENYTGKIKYISYMTKEGLLAQGLHKTFGVHLAKAKYVEGPSIFKHKESTK